MKLEYNGQQIFELTETQKKVIKNDIPSSIFEDDMCRRCKYWLEAPVEKFAHLNRKKLEADIRKKGVKNVPIKRQALMAKFAEIEPPKHGLEDIDKPIPCKVGNQSFELSVNCQKGWRKLNQNMQEKMSKDEYIAHEQAQLSNRMAWILQHKYERCFERLKHEWLSKLEARGFTEIPSEPDEFAELVFSQPDYQDRDAKDLNENSGRN